MAGGNNGGKTVDGRGDRGRFAPGNSGRPLGARHKATLAVEALMEGEAEAITRKAVDAAKDGDMTAIRICLDRLAPARRDRAVLFDLPTVNGAEDHPAAIAAIIKAVADGDLSPGEAESICRMFAEHRVSVVNADLEARLSRIESERGPA